MPHVDHPRAVWAESSRGPFISERYESRELMPHSQGALDQLESRPANLQQRAAHREDAPRLALGGRGNFTGNSRAARGKAQMAPGGRGLRGAGGESQGRQDFRLEVRAVPAVPMMLAEGWG